MGQTMGLLQHSAQHCLASVSLQQTQGVGSPSETEEEGEGASLVPDAENCHRHNDAKAGHLRPVVEMRKLRGSLR